MIAGMRTLIERASLRGFVDHSGISSTSDEDRQPDGLFTLAVIRDAVAKLEAAKVPPLVCALCGVLAYVLVEHPVDRRWRWHCECGRVNAVDPSCRSLQQTAPEPTGSPDSDPRES